MGHVRQIVWPPSWIFFKICFGHISATVHRSFFIFGMDTPEDISNRLRSGGSGLNKPLVYNDLLLTKIDFENKKREGAPKDFYV